VEGEDRDMSIQREKALREAGLAFFGAVTASLSHELNNVYAIVNELAGVLEDHVIAAERGGGVSPAKVEEVAGKIQAQVERGRVLVKRLNSFAHSCDEPVATVSLCELLEMMAAICRRFADMERVRLEYEPAENDVDLTTNPFVLEHAVFVCIRSAVDCAADKRLVRVYNEVTERGAAVCVESADGVPDLSGGNEDVAMLPLLAAELGGEIQHLSAAGGGSQFKLLVPRSVQRKGP